MARELSQVLDCSECDLLSLGQAGQLQFATRTAIRTGKLNYLRDKHFQGQYEPNRFYDRKPDEQPTR